MAAAVRLAPIRSSRRASAGNDADVSICFMLASTPIWRSSSEGWGRLSLKTTV